MGIRWRAEPNDQTLDAVIRFPTPSKRPDCAELFDRGEDPVAVATLHKRKHADLARYLLHPSHDVRCAGGGPCAALLIDPPHSFPVAREHTRARHQLVQARNQLGEGALNRPRGHRVCSRRLCPTVASTTSRSARFVVDSCQPPINFRHRNYWPDLPV